MPAETQAVHLKITRGFSHRVLEGKGDTFLRKRFIETHAHQSFNTTLEKSEGPIPICEGDTFREISPH
jgi:hypothetical protein